MRLCTAAIFGPFRLIWFSSFRLALFFVLHQFLVFLLVDRRRYFPGFFIFFVFFFIHSSFVFFFFSCYFTFSSSSSPLSSFHFTLRFLHDRHFLFLFFYLIIIIFFFSVPFLVFISLSYFIFFLFCHVWSRVFYSSCYSHSSSCSFFALVYLRVVLFIVFLCFFFLPQSCSLITKGN